MNTPIQSVIQRFVEQNTNIFDHNHAIVINPENIFQSITPFFEQVTYVCLREDQVNAQCQHLSIIDFLNDPKIDQSELILILPKAKKLTEILLHWLSQQNLEHTNLWVVGENDLGAKSFDKLAKIYNFESNLVDTARRCRIFELYPASKVDKPFNLTAHLKSFESEGKKLSTLPSVFSHGHLDKGTQVLISFLKQNPQNIKGDILDFACGCGVIAQFCTQYSASITGLDTDYLSIYCANNANAQNKTSIKYITSNGLPKHVIDQYDWIISNPPFHENKRTNYSITETFIQQSIHHLKPNGKLLMVVNDFLDYESTVKESFNEIEILYSQKGFKIIKATK
ncbi:methyltransferase [Marinicellulosiphila megalodicopiae]|uniref:methyltransferase n=1 Tax=Marinicellulosiphila megalodicopiae TaxID=2724896 RepID=UPI003BB02DA4